MTLIIDFDDLTQLSVCHHCTLTSVYNIIRQHTRKKVKRKWRSVGWSSVTALRLHTKQYINLILFPPILFRP